MTTDLAKLAQRADRKENRRLPCTKLLRQDDLSYWDVAYKAGVSATTVANTLLHGQRNRKVLAAIRTVLADHKLSDEGLFGIGS